MARPKIVEKISGKLGIEYIACTRSTVLAVSRNYSIYSWGLTPDYTTAESIPQKPTLLTIFKSKRVREIQCLRDTFLICSDYIVQNSYITGIPFAGIEAGKKCCMKINLIDSSLMFVVDPIDKIGVVAFNQNGSISKGETLTFWDENQYKIELKINEAGYHSVFVFCNGIQLKNSPFIFTVKNSGFFEAKAYVNSETVLINAGVGFVALIKVYDKFGNLVLENPEIKFSINITGTCDIVDFEEGCYRVIIYCTGIGKHNLMIKGNEKLVPITYKEITGEDQEKEVWTHDFIDVQVLPGLISLKDCVVEGLKQYYTVAEPINFKIITKDQYNNTTWHRSKPWTLEVPITYSINESADFCTSFVSLTSFKSGTFPLKITYDTYTLIDTNIIIIPGPVFIPNLLITGHGKNNSIYEKACEKDFFLEFFDEYFNPCVPLSLIIETDLRYDLQNIDLNKFRVRYEVNKPGKYSFNIKTNNGNYILNVSFEKDPKLIKQEKIEEERLEKARKKLLDEEKMRENQELKKRIEEERNRASQIREKQRLMEENAKKQKEMEDAEMARRQKIVERIKLQEITKRRAVEALQKLEEEKKKKEPKKWKRIGGGFVVPFIIDESND